MLLMSPSQAELDFYNYHDKRDMKKGRGWFAVVDVANNLTASTVEVRHSDVTISGSVVSVTFPALPG